MKILALSFFIVSLWLADARTVSWDDLKDVKFTRKFIKEEDMYFLFPTFGEKVKKLNGTELQIKGYMIPVDPEDKVYVLSARPMASCFFCGGSGPETIIQLNLKTRKKFRTDEIWTVKGKFRLNADNLDECNYVLDGCEAVIRH
ncbi:MAG: DUF3299 domain-containing protein [Leadbetterella sp.]|nr:DUF3299 domain-containing protein [Leadbetterella sp.]